jgi:DNA-3-methyladenine glycosylase (3mg)
MKKLPREFYLRPDTIETARDLLGKTLVVPAENGERVSGVIVETEAYLGAMDKASHAFGNRRTPRTEIMFEEGGRAYVFFIYGMYFQLNVTTGAKDSPHCVLIRAVEPSEGIEKMRERRRLKKNGALQTKMPDVNLTSGPGKLCIAFGIDKSYNGDSLLGERIWIENGGKISDSEIMCGSRIGIDYAAEFAEKPWRFWIKNNPFVSRR